MTEHRLSLFTEPFEATMRGQRQAEHRWMVDRHFEVGDVLVLEERPERADAPRRTIRRRVTYIDRQAFGIRPGYGLIHHAPLVEESSRAS